MGEVHTLYDDITAKDAVTLRAFKSEFEYNRGVLAPSVYSFSQLDGSSSSNLIDFSCRITWSMAEIGPISYPPQFHQRHVNRAYGCLRGCQPKFFSPIIIQSLGSERKPHNLTQAVIHEDAGIASYDTRFGSFNINKSELKRYLRNVSRNVRLNAQCDVTNPLACRKYQCMHCKVACANSGQLKGHVRVHTGERPYKCRSTNCGRAFARNEELTRHTRIHLGVRPHKCPDCGKLFGRKDHLNKHIKTHLTTSEKKTHRCTVAACRQTYTRSDALARHVWAAHGSKPSRPR